MSKPDSLSERAALRNAASAYAAAAILIREAQTMLDVCDVDTHPIVDESLFHVNNAARAIQAQLRYGPAASYTDMVPA